ncbi:MAG TPA: YdeI/OmpD-associated family protein [Nitrososphaerales archaeon]
MRTLRVSKPSDWRSWLEKNHDKEDGVWLVFLRKGSGEPSISYEEAVGEALAFGWIDSLIKKIDERQFARKFTPRRPWSIWSKLNILRVEKLIGEGRMTSRGLAAYQMRTPEISLLEKINIEGVTIPSDFGNALRRNKKAWKNFERFGPSYKKRYIIWISGAKTPKIRARRIAEAVVLVSRNVKSLLK